VIEVDWHGARLAKRHGIRGWEAALAVAVPGRWVRLGAFWGEAPGSVMYGRHWAVWRAEVFEAGLFAIPGKTAPPGEALAAALDAMSAKCREIAARSPR
jgi:hypothetical protein